MSESLVKADMGHLLGRWSGSYPEVEFGASKWPVEPRLMHMGDQDWHVLCRLCLQACSHTHLWYLSVTCSGHVGKVHLFLAKPTVVVWTLKNDLWPQAFSRWTLLFSAVAQPSHHPNLQDFFFHRARSHPSILFQPSSATTQVIYPTSS